MNSSSKAELTSFQGVDCQGIINDASLLEQLKQQPIMDILATGRILKEDQKRCVAVIELNDGTEIFVKIHLEYSLLNSLKSLALRSPAERSHHKALAFIGRGLPTPETLGFITFTHNQQGASAQFSRFLVNAQTMSEVLKAAPEQHQNYVELVFEQLALMHNQGFVHGDLKLNNIMLQDQKFYYIDLDGIARSTTKHARSKDLARLIVALSEAEVALAHMQKAFHEYCLAVGLDEDKILPNIRQIAHRIQQKHLLKYDRPPKQIL